MESTRTGTPLQPLLHEAVVALRAPAQAWSAPDGSMGDAPIHGIYLGDTRVLSGLALALDGRQGEHLVTTVVDAATVRFDALFRALDEPGTADPDVRLRLTRTVRPDGADHRIELSSRRALDISAVLRVELTADLTSMTTVKSGAAAVDATSGTARSTATSTTATPDGAQWTDGDVTATVSARNATVAIDGTAVTLEWTMQASPRTSTEVSFGVTAEDASAVVHAAEGSTPWAAPSEVELASADDRLVRWLGRALDDLDALRMVSDRAPDEQFLAAGAPWFFTLFGRDSLWAARLLLPLGSRLAASTLRALASMQGAASVIDTAEQPGKIMHELRRGAQQFDEGAGTVELPPLYYGSIDATPLWICLLADAADAGMPDDEVRALLPNLEAALNWMRDFGDSDGDGLLEYIDESGRGLSNQGWKDSGDSVQWRDGRLADGPIALCEVQAYAYQAAIGGATLLERFERPGAVEWREWATRLQNVFRQRYWIDDPAGAYPAIALDAQKRPVDTLTSNIGHLLGTGLLHPDEAALVARRLVSPELASGFGLRTLSTDSAGYWPLSYHGGSVWTHDTAIAIAGLTADGFVDEARQLAEGLLRAAVAFDYRMPELHSGDTLAETPTPAPYPAACRPQAWSAAAAVTVLTALR